MAANTTAAAANKRGCEHYARAGRDRGLLEEALAEFERAVELDAGEPKYHLNCAAVFFQLGDFAASRARCELFVSVERFFVPPRANLIARAYCRLGRIAECENRRLDAVRHYERARLLCDNRVTRDLVLSVARGACEAHTLAKPVPLDTGLLWCRDDARGRFVCAARDLPAHTLLYREAPIAAFPRRLLVQELVPFFPNDTKWATLANWESFNASAELGAALRRAGWTDETVGADFALFRGPACDNGDDSPVGRAVRANEFGMHCAFSRWFYGNAIYRAASSFNHSCAPNATYHFGHGGDILVFSRGAPIRAGEEVTIGYASFDAAASCTCLRQAELLAKAGFACACAECRAHPCDLLAEHSRAAYELACRIGTASVLSPADAVRVWRAERTAMLELPDLRTGILVMLALSLTDARPLPEDGAQLLRDAAVVALLHGCEDANVSADMLLFSAIFRELSALGVRRETEALVYVFGAGSQFAVDRLLFGREEEIALIMNFGMRGEWNSAETSRQMALLHCARGWLFHVWRQARGLAQPAEIGAGLFAVSPQFAMHRFMQALARSELSTFR
jgi:hypothetical protein